MNSNPNNPKHINLNPDAKFIQAQSEEIKPIYFSKDSLEFINDILSHYDRYFEVDIDDIWENIDTDPDIIYYFT